MKGEIKKTGKKQRITQRIVEGLDGRVREVVNSRIGEEIGARIDEEIDGRVGGIKGGIDEGLSEGVEEICGGEGETVMGGQRKGGSDVTIRCLCSSETEKGKWHVVMCVGDGQLKPRDGGERSGRSIDVGIQRSVDRRR